MRTTSPRRTASKRALGVLLICASAFATGCAQRTRSILIPRGDPVRVRTPITVDIWVLDASGHEIPTTMLIPEGWWILPDPGDEPR